MAEFTLYTPEIKQFINTRDWPEGLVMDVYENHDPEPHLNLVFYRDNWLKFDYDDQLKITTIVKEIMAKLWPNTPCYVGKMENVPRR